MDFNTYMQDKKKLVEKHLEELIPEGEDVPVIYEAMRYSIFAGSKRLRPILAIMACELFDGDISEVMPFACSLEMIHTYSLIHDDLPAMDNDDYRRGKPTNHKVYGAGFATLAGDALLNLAFETIIEQLVKKPQKNYLQAAQIIGSSSGTKGMIGGQCIDLHYENSPIDHDTLTRMHDKKTGALIAASLMTGASIAGASLQDMAAIEKYGKLIGLAFQIADDILDEEGSTEKLGKKVGSDKDNHKATFVTLHGLAKSKQVASKITAEAIETISIYGTKGRYLKELARFIIDREI